MPKSKSPAEQRLNSDRIYRSEAELAADVLRFGRVALRTDQLPPDIIEALKQVAVPQGYGYLDALLDDDDGQNPPFVKPPFS